MINLNVHAISQLMAVTGNGGGVNLEKNAFYSINTTGPVGEAEKGRVTFIGYTAEVEGNRVIANQLAYDPSTENYYYMENSGSKLYRYKDGVNHELADLADSGTVSGGNEMPVGTKGAGGGDFYNGSYYYTPEPDTQSIYRVMVSNDGSQFVSQSLLTPTNLADISLNYVKNGSVRNDGLGDFGDFAINATTGIMYGSSTFYGNNGDEDGEYNTLWSMDLTAEDLTMKVLNYDLESVHQLAINETGELWGVQSDGTMHRFKKEAKNSGVILETVQISDNIDGSWGNTLTGFNDLASTQSRIGEPLNGEPFNGAAVPEPSSLLFLFSSIPLVLRRRR